MTAYPPTAAAPAAPRTPLALVTLLVLIAHALLLLGLPHWAHTVSVTGGPPVFETRTLALMPPPDDATPTPVPPTPPVTPQPRPKPAPDADKPAPPPVPDVPATPNTPTPDAHPSDVHPPPSSTTTGPSLLQAAPPVAFGGKSPLPPIEPPLPPDEALAVMRQAAQPAIPVVTASAAASDARTPGTPESPPPIQLPRAAEITYQATVTQSGRLVTLPSTVNWRHDGQSYDLRWTLYGPTIGDHSRYATGLVTARGLAPVSARGAGPHGYDVLFDYAQSRLSSTALPLGTPVTGVPNRPGSARPGMASALPVISAASAAHQSAVLPLPPGVQDPASLLFELGALVAGDPARYPVGSHVALPVVDGVGLAPLADFAIVGDDDLPLTGKFQGQHQPALHLVHEPATAQDTRIELWLVKSMDYLPARLLIVHPNGDTWDMAVQDALLQTVPPPPAP